MESFLSGGPSRAPGLVPPVCALTSPLLQPPRWELWPRFTTALTRLRRLTEDPQLERTRSWKRESFLCDPKLGNGQQSPEVTPTGFSWPHTIRKHPQGSSKQNTSSCFLLQSTEPGFIHGGLPSASSCDLPAPPAPPSKGSWYLNVDASREVTDFF